MRGQIRLLGGRKLKSPIGNPTRPTTSRVREAIVNILGKHIEDTSWLDLYSGSGTIGCEAIQRGAKTIVAIEINKNIFNICRSNLTMIANSSKKDINIEVINTDVKKFLNIGYREFCRNLLESKCIKLSQFDFVYIDPPYKINPYFSILEKLIKGNWASKKCIAICEFSKQQKIIIPSDWHIHNQKFYGNTGLVFLTPNQA